VSKLVNVRGESLRFNFEHWEGNRPGKKEGEDQPTAWGWTVFGTSQKGLWTRKSKSMRKTLAGRRSLSRVWEVQGQCIGRDIRQGKAGEEANSCNREEAKGSPHGEKNAPSRSRADSQADRFERGFCEGSLRGQTVVPKGGG